MTGRETRGMPAARRCCIICARSAAISGRHNRMFLRCSEKVADLANHSFSHETSKSSPIALPGSCQDSSCHGDSAAASAATVVIIHGGYWKNRFGIGDEYGNAGTASIAPYFAERGFAAVELEYRRRDHHGGGWPGTNEVLAIHRAPSCGWLPK